MWYRSKGFGVWRSLVARTTGGREVAGSNPVTPILYGFEGCRRNEYLDIFG